MTTPAAALLNLLGFIMGSGLYAMLLTMVLREPSPVYDPYNARRTIATVLVPTTEPPQYRLLIGELAGGRRPEAVL
jgi:hypothetical protein